MVSAKSPARLAIENRLHLGPASREELLRVAMTAVHPSIAIRRRRGKIKNSRPTSLAQEVFVGKRIVAMQTFYNMRSDGKIRQLEDEDYVLNL